VAFFVLRFWRLAFGVWRLAFGVWRLRKLTTYKDSSFDF
jgi:hypothetical protein